MGGFLGWLSAHPDVLGIAAFVLTSVIARYMPDTPFWLAVRAWVTDYANRNAKALPQSLEVRVVANRMVGIFVDGREVKRMPLIETWPADGEALTGDNRAVKP